LSAGDRIRHGDVPLNGGVEQALLALEKERGSGIVAKAVISEVTAILDSLHGRRTRDGALLRWLEAEAIIKAMETYVSDEHGALGEGRHGRGGKVGCTEGDVQCSHCEEEGGR
jgi:hypothetical protein